MAQTLSLALQITLVGMGLVFIGILALWAMMALLVRLFADKKEKSLSETEMAADETTDREQKRLAAAIAVASAIGIQNTSITLSTHKDRAMISAWQAAHRSHQVYRSAPSFPRKNRGSKS